MFFIVLPFQKDIEEMISHNTIAASNSKGKRPMSHSRRRTLAQRLSIAYYQGTKTTTLVHRSFVWRFFEYEKHI